MRDLHNSPTRYVMKLSSAIRNVLDSMVEGTSVTPMEARALLFIATATEAIYQKDLEQEYGLSRATVSELMLNMEQKGMICRQRDLKDHRRKRITVCASVRPLADRMIERMSAMEDQLAKDIGDEEMSAFLMTIERMTRNAPPGQRCQP